MLPDIAMPMPDAMPGLPALSNKEKAAIVVRLLLDQGAVPALSRLPEKKQTELAIQLARMRSVDQQTVMAVAEEFAVEIERIALSFPEGIADTLGLLDKALSEPAKRELRKLNPDVETGDPWEIVNASGSETLLPLLDSEAVEVAAVIISKLTVAKSAELLGKMSGDSARRITYAVSRTADVAPDVVYRIGRSLADQLEVKAPISFEEEPVSRVGAILNYTPASVRDTIMEGLDQEDREFADQVRAAIFTFANIPERISPRDIPRVQRDIAQEDLATVLASAQGNDVKSIEFILENISKRLAENLQDEAKELGDISVEDSEAAMLRIVATIRELEEKGEIFFTTGDG